MPKRKRAGRERRARAQINFAIKQEYERQRREALTAPQIRSCVALNPPLPRAIIDAIKRRPVRVPRDKIVPLEYIDSAESSRNLDIHFPIIHLDSNDLSDADTIVNSPRVSIIDLTSPPSVEIINEIPICDLTYD